eukprot:scaffold211998_cov28-Tisochrysis_lutea.AAC.2
MSYEWTSTYASAYTGSDRPVSCVTRLSRAAKSSSPLKAPVAEATMSSSSSNSSAAVSGLPPFSCRTEIRSSACLLTSGTASSDGFSPSSCDARSLSIEEKASWQWIRQSCCTSSPGFDSRCK